MLGIGPGKKVGEIIRTTTEYILDNNISNQDDIDKYIKDNWA